MAVDMLEGVGGSWGGGGGAAPALGLGRAPHTALPEQSGWAVAC